MSAKQYFNRYFFYILNMLMWVLFIMSDFYHLTIKKDTSSPVFVIMSCFIFIFWCISFFHAKINDRINNMNKRLKELASYMLDAEGYKEYLKIEEDDLDV